MLNKKNGMFILSIVVLSIAGLLFLGTFAARYFSGSVWVYLDLALFAIPDIVLSLIALVRSIIYLVRELPRAKESMIMSSISLILLVLTGIMLAFLLGTGRLPHEIFY